MMKNYLKSDLTIQTDKQFQNLLLYKLIFQNSFLAVQTSKQITSLIFADFLAIISVLKETLKQILMVSTESGLLLSLIRLRGQKVLQDGSGNRQKY